MTEDAITYRVRRCCNGGPGSHRRLIEPAEQIRDTTPHEWTGEVVEEIARHEEPRWVNVALHEAGHAVVAIGLGARVNGAQIDGAPLASIDFSGVLWRASVMILEAGDIAKNWGVQWHDSPCDEELVEHARAIRELPFGFCDRCRTFIQIVSKIGLDVPDTEYLKCYRDLEGQTIDIVRRRNVWTAIEELADALMEHGVLTGQQVHDIVEPLVPIGSLKIGEEDVV
ncbi:hypothetical protein V5F38_12175 [Xanthobacter sp. V0B-10]|uniref:hypothetical protein n=1 Tax=Xanthobacter albus TaxID=3119929 RepID=UPI003729498A